MYIINLRFSNKYRRRIQKKNYPGVVPESTYSLSKYWRRIQKELTSSFPRKYIQLLFLDLAEKVKVISFKKSKRN